MVCVAYAAESAALTITWLLWYLGFSIVLVFFLGVWATLTLSRMEKQWGEDQERLEDGTFEHDPTAAENDDEMACHLEREGKIRRNRPRREDFSDDFYGPRIWVGPLSFRYRR